MPSQDFIDVRVLVNGQPLQEYADAHGTRDENQKTTRYVQVTAGQKFTVLVTLCPGFDFLGAPQVLTELKIDQDENFMYETIAYRDANAYRGILQSPEKVTYDSSHGKDDSTGKWYNYDFEFGALGVSKLSSIRPYM